MGNRIAHYRSIANMTQIEIAETFGITQGAVSQWETGETTPRGTLLKRLASALNCTIDDLLSEQPESDT